MHRRQRGWIGIDLGARAIKIAQVERVGGGLRLVDAVAMQRGPRGADDRDATLWRAAEIRAALALAPKLRGKVAACSLSSQQSSLRTLRLPPGTPRQLRAMIASQLAPAVSATGTASAFDYWQLDNLDRGADDQQKLAVLAVDDDVAVEAAEEIERAGLQCRLLDGQPLCVSRAIEMLQAEGSTATCAALDWGYERATLSIVRHGVPQFTRELRRCGVARLICAVSQGLGVSPDDAQQLLTQYGLPAPTPHEPRAGDATIDGLQAIVHEIVASPLHALTTEIEKTLHYLRFQRPELHPQSIYLLGGGAVIRHIDEHLSQHLSLPLNLWMMPLGSARLESGQRIHLPMIAGAIALSALAWVK